MTRDEIIEMAREAGLSDGTASTGHWWARPDSLERFAALVAAKEREACALQMMQEHENYRSAADASDDHDNIDWCQAAALVYGRAADAIRARSQ